MSFILVDLLDPETGETFEELYSRSEAPPLGEPFAWEDPTGRVRTVHRLVASPQKAQVKSVECIAYSRPRWDPAFKHHTSRGFGVVTGQKDLDRALDTSKRRARSEDDEWTWNQE